MDLAAVLRGGFQRWRKNMVLGIPFLLNFLLILIMASILVGILIFALFGHGVFELSPEEMLKEMLKNIELIVIAGIIFLIFSVLISSFFTAGVIGMAKKAVHERADLHQMLLVGKKKFPAIFISNLIIVSIVSAGILFILPGYKMLADFQEVLVSEDRESFLRLLPKAGMLILGFLLWGLYAVAIHIIFSLVPYSIVVDDVGPLDGIRRGVGFFLRNPVDVFLLWLLIASLFLSLGFVSRIFYMVPLLGILWTPVYYGTIIFILLPVSTLWWTFLYMFLEK
jgi:hypothetical protein